MTANFYQSDTDIFGLFYLRSNERIKLLYNYHHEQATETISSLSDITGYTVTNKSVQSMQPANLFCKDFFLSLKSFNVIIER